MLFFGENFIIHSLCLVAIMALGAKKRAFCHVFCGKINNFTPTKPFFLRQDNKKAVRYGRLS